MLYTYTEQQFHHTKQEKQMTAILKNPIPLQQWTDVNKPAENLIYAKGYGEQIVFIRDRITSLLAKNYEEYETIAKNIKVISTHTSKSVLLPVYQIELPDGTLFIMRYNFHNWKVSVISEKEVNADFMDLFDPNEKIHSVYCEGFSEKYVFGPYAKNKRSFTVELSSGYNHLFTFFWVFAYQVLGKRCER